jgi:hypothetical protein
MATTEQEETQVTKQERALKKLQSWRVKGRKCYTFEQIAASTTVNAGLLCRVLKGKVTLTDGVAARILEAKEPTV